MVRIVRELLRLLNAWWRVDRIRVTRGDRSTATHVSISEP